MVMLPKILATVLGAGMLFALHHSPPNDVRRHMLILAAAAPPIALLASL